MGKLIDEGLLQEKLALIPMEERTFRRTVEELENASPVEAIEKANYEARLKADMVAMLTEIQTEIDEVPRYRMTNNGICVYREMEEYMSDVNNVIQKIIHSLREESEVKE